MVGISITISRVEFMQDCPCCQTIFKCYFQGFFRRSLKKKSAYMCAYDEKCDTTSSKRNVCAACRFKKCTNVGMSKSGELAVSIQV